MAKTDSGSSDESEDFNDTMGDPLETTMSENQVNPESTDQVQVSLSCADCGERKEKIEKLQKTRSKLNRRIAGLKKENENLRKVGYRDLNLPHYSSTARNHKSYLDLQRFFAHPYSIIYIHNWLQRIHIVPLLTPVFKKFKFTSI